MYTIDELLKNKREIYNYCINLTYTNNMGIIVKHEDRAKDLFQEVCLATIDFLNKKSDIIKDNNHFLKLIKMITYYKHKSTYSKQGSNRVQLNKTYIDDSIVSFINFENKYYCNLIPFNKDENPEYQELLKYLNTTEKKLIELIIEGYYKDEIKKELALSNQMMKYHFDNLKNKVTSYYNYSNQNIEFKDIKLLLQDKYNITDNESNLLIAKYLNKKHLKDLYTLYLNGLSNKAISNIFNKSTNQINQEIFRINNKLKKYFNNKDGI